MEGKQEKRSGRKPLTEGFHQQLIWQENLHPPFIFNKGTRRNVQGIAGTLLSVEKKWALLYFKQSICQEEAASGQNPLWAMRIGGEGTEQGRG